MGQKRFLLFIEVLITIIIIYSIMPIVSRLFSTYLTTYTYMFVILVCLILILISRGKQSFNEYAIVLIPFIIWKLFDYAVTMPSFILWGYSSLLDFAPIIIGYFIITRMDYKKIKYFSVLILLSLIVTSITTIIGLQIYPDASRYLATVADANETKNILYNFMNIGGYQFVYSLVLIYPVIIYGYKRKKIHLFFLIIFAGLTLFVILYSGYTIALLLFLISTIFIFLRKNLSSRNVLIIIIFALILLAIFYRYISDFFNFLADIIDNKNIEERLRALAGGREGLEASDDNRLDLYLLSITTFLKNPLFGAMFNSDYYHYIGGHSFILDMLGLYGLFGLFLLVFMYRFIYKTFFKTYKNKTGYGFVFWMFLQTIILSTVNTGMWLYVLCLYMPVILTFIDRGGHKDESTLGSKLNSQSI